MAKFRKKPVIIEAIQFTEECAWKSFLDKEFIWPEKKRFHASGDYNPDNKTIYRAWVSIETLEGTMQADLGDWIICGVKGEFYPCKPDIFAATYEPAD